MPKHCNDRDVCVSPITEERIRNSSSNAYKTAKENRYFHVESRNLPYHTERELDRGMGCSQSTSVPANGSGAELEDQVFLPNSSSGENTQPTPTPVTNKDSVESSSGDEDQDKLYSDLGRQQVSDADLIQVQRSEKPDVTPVLEDRWLRSHFSGTKAAATTRISSNNIAQRFEEDSLKNAQIKTPEFQNNAINLTDTVKKHQCASVAVDGKIHSGDITYGNVQHRLSILHFNDVYELTEGNREPVGGASRFARLFEQAKKDCHQQNPFVIFSGDCLNPSILSSATKGQHMIDVLNYFGIHASVFGNHEFDFGIEHAVSCVQRMKFPWFLSNVIEKERNSSMADGRINEIFQHNGIKIGIMGLIEEEWLDTLATVDKDDLIFQNFVQRGNELSRKMREDGADLIIALTHMRWPNDIHLAQEVTDIDLILGGHDHEYGVWFARDCLIIKSGCDFKTFSRVEICMNANGCKEVSVRRYDVTSEVEEDTGMKEIVQKYTLKLEKQLQESIGITKTDLDGCYDHIRSRETNLGNFVADIMRMTTKAQVVLINSGTFRSNAIHKSGAFLIRDLMTILPIHDRVVVIEVTGQQFLDGLENAVSKYPQHEGRFPQISGFTFGFDSTAPPLKRVIRESVLINGQPIELNQVYIMATKAYVARGKDGYRCFERCTLLSDPDTGPVLSTVVRNHLSNVQTLLKHEEKTGTKIRVTANGKKVISATGNLHEVYSSCFAEEEDPVYKLQKSMEEVVPKNTDSNNNNRLRNGKNKNSESEVTKSPRTVKKNSVASPSKYDEIGGTGRKQHLVEICKETIFDKGYVPRNEVEKRRILALKREGENFSLLQERQLSSDDVKWQVLPLLEARIFHW